MVLFVVVVIRVMVVIVIIVIVLVVISCYCHYCPGCRCLVIIFGSWFLCLSLFAGWRVSVFDLLCWSGQLPVVDCLFDG